MRGLGIRLVATAAVAVTLSTAGIAATALGNDELPPGGTFWDDYLSVHEADIEAIAAEGVTRGCNPPTNDRYCPDKTVDRGQIAAFLARALALPPSPTDWFTDDGESEFEGDINRLAYAGITKGCNPPDNDRYCPEDVVERDQLASFFTRAFGYDPIVPPPVTGIDDRWPHRFTVLTDSVVLGAEKYLPNAFPGWQMDLLGKPALMLHQVEDTFLPHGRTVGSVVVVGLGYNSLWERDRLNFDKWSARFDEQADEVVRVLTEHGALKIAWILLREPAPEAVQTAQQKDQMYRWGWYLPYVNERIRLLPDRHPNVVVADWATASSGQGFTYDLIHLNPAGARLMTNVVAESFELDPPYE